MQTLGQRYKLDAALLPVTTFRIPMTLNENSAVRAAQALQPRCIVPIHEALQPRTPFIRTGQTV